jgi:hypothetical protein
MNNFRIYTCQEKKKLKKRKKEKKEKEKITFNSMINKYINFELKL